MNEMQRLLRELTKIADSFTSLPGVAEDVSDRGKKALRNRFSTNLRINEVYTDSMYTHLIITNRETHKSWRYYAGLEYATDPVIVDVGEEIYVAVYSAEDGRVEKILDLIRSIDDPNYGEEEDEECDQETCPDDCTGCD